MLFFFFCIACAYTITSYIKIKTFCFVIHLECLSTHCSWLNWIMDGMHDFTLKWRSSESATDLTLTTERVPQATAPPNHHPLMSTPVSRHVSAVPGNSLLQTSYKLCVH